MTADDKLEEARATFRTKIAVANHGDPERSVKDSHGDRREAKFTVEVMEISWEEPKGV